MPKPKDQRFIRISVVQSEKPIREILALVSKGLKPLHRLKRNGKKETLLKQQFGFRRSKSFMNHILENCPIMNLFYRSYQIIPNLIV